MPASMPMGKSSAHRPTPRKVPATRSWADIVGSVLCSLVLTSGNLATGYLVFLGYMVQPGGADWVGHYQFAFGFTLLLAAFTALLTWIFVKAEWLRTWWYAVPATLAIAAMLGLTLLVPHL